MSERTGVRISDLKLDDEVVVRTDYGLQCIVYKVGRITDTQILLVGSGIRFRRKDGRALGYTGFSAPYLDTSAQAFRDARRQLAEARFCRRFPFTQKGVSDDRASADLAEWVLREAGEWKDD